MNVYLFGFDKKKNSTAKPALNTGTMFSCQLKEETSVLNPALIFNPASSGMPVPFVPSYFTYAYVQNFNRYYFISDWQYLNGVWICYLSVDVLASFKDAIGSESCYIERASSAYNGDIIDKLYPAKTDVEIVSATIATSWSNVAPSGGCYIVGCINYQTSNHVGAVSYYAMTTAELNSMLNFLFTDTIYVGSNIQEIGEGLFKSLFNPFQYIVSCMWFPGAASIYGSTSTTIKVGYWDTGVTAVMVSALADIRFVTGTIPDHPQISRGAYLNYAPYTTITLYCPPFGEIPIDPTFLRTGKYLYAKVIIDTITGLATIRVTFRANGSAPYAAKACAEKTAMMGVPIQLAQILADYSGAVSSVTGGIGGGYIGILTGLIGATIDTAINSQAPKVSSNGANGSFINFALDPDLVVEHRLLVNEDLADLGRPLMEKRKINTLSGYIKCAEAHFSGSCYEQERDDINSFLTAGFYYE